VKGTGKKRCQDDFYRGESRLNSRLLTHPPHGGWSRFCEPGFSISRTGGKPLGLQFIQSRRDTPYLADDRSPSSGPVVVRLKKSRSLPVPFSFHALSFSELTCLTSAFHLWRRSACFSKSVPFQFRGSGHLPWAMRPWFRVRSWFRGVQSGTAAIDPYTQRVVNPRAPARILAASVRAIPLTSQHFGRLSVVERERTYLPETVRKRPRGRLCAPRARPRPPAASW
jgi:hypothetical protein